MNGKTTAGLVDVADALRAAGYDVVAKSSDGNLRLYAYGHTGEVARIFCDALGHTRYQLDRVGSRTEMVADWHDGALAEIQAWLLRGPATCERMGPTPGRFVPADPAMPAITRTVQGTWQAPLPGLPCFTDLDKAIAATKAALLTPEATA